MRGRVLVVDDDQESCRMLEETLSHRGFEVSWATDPEQGLNTFSSEGPFDALLTDLRLGRASGIDLCRKVLELEPAFPVVVITGYGSIGTAVEAMRAGAYDFITKPFEVELVALALDRAVRHTHLQRELRAIRDAAGVQHEGTLGKSPVMQRILETIDKVAANDAPVLISGESGTGKEFAARVLHSRSPRAGAPFLTINCATTSEQLLESELFGSHLPGASAIGGPEGAFLRASPGTLLLDEIGELSPSMQVKLLRALQTRTVLPVGSYTEVPFDTRVIAATHRDLEAEVAAGRFRQDLFFRIHVVEVLLPPLRARGGDVLHLAVAFLRRYGQRAGKHDLRLSAAVAEHLLKYEWPGNVRELENSIERAVALTQGSEIMLEDLPERVRRGGNSDVLISATGSDELVTLEEMERRYILQVMRAVGNSKKVAAQVLGLDRSTLYRKLGRYGMD